MIPPLKFVPRSEWGAKPPAKAWRWDSLNPSEAWLHHTVGYSGGGAGYMRQMQAQHQSQGWTDVAYHDVLDPATLTVYEGTPCGARPAAQKGHNVDTYTLCVMGNFNTEAVPASLTTALGVWVAWRHRGHNAPDQLDGGHRDAPGQATTGPGKNLHAEIPAINARITEALMAQEHIAADRIDAYGDHPGIDAWAETSFAHWLEHGVFGPDTGPDAVMTSERLGALFERFERYLARRYGL